RSTERSFLVRPSRRGRRSRWIMRLFAVGTTLAMATPRNARALPSPSTKETEVMRIKFWGVRGSIASPGPDTAAVGGNTSCVEVLCGDTRIVLDAGTGLRRLGEAPLAELAQT